MYKVAFLYAPNDGKVKQAALVMENALDKKVFKIKSKDALTGTVTSIAGADLVILGTETTSSSPCHKDFTEIFRALEGINLGGRVCALYSSGPRSSFSTFKKAFKDTNIDIYEEFFSLQDKVDASEISKWMKHVISYFKERKKT
ncbi:MAG: hypothetical protein JW969_17650 [Spirochaetales bacterium]|nr:hypothetical protein [Spirochaetales bacterium]